MQGLTMTLLAFSQQGEALGELQEEIDDLREELRSYARYDDLDHYEPPESPEEMFRREIGEWADWKKTRSAVFQNIIREGLDPESLAFCFLPDDVQKRLMN